MCLMAERREIGANMMTPLTPEYEEKLVALQDEGLAWEVLVASPTVFEVISERSHMVDLEHETCTCQRWRVYGFPCHHALAAIQRLNLKLLISFQRILQVTILGRLIYIPSSRFPTTTGLLKFKKTTPSTRLS